MRKTISTIITFSLILSMLSVTASAKKSGVNGDVCSPDNPEACEISISEDMIEQDAPEPVQMATSPKTGEFFETMSLKASNLDKKLDNIDITFKKTEFSNVKGKKTTKANGKPKIVVISKYNCYFCDVLTGQLKDAKKNGELGGVDVIQVNIEESNVTSDAWSYVYHVTGKFSIGTPTVIYINSKNQIIDYTMGTSFKDGKITEQLKKEFGKNILDAKYTIKFNGNGATNGNMPNQKIKLDGKKHKIKENSFKRKGYKFEGWALSKKGKVKYKNKESIKNISGGKSTVTLYAIWKKK